LTAAVGLALAAVLASIVVGCDEMIDDQRLQACGGTVPGNRVERTVDLSRARDYRLSVPEIGEHPELNVDAPVFLVLFEGQATILEVHQGVQAKFVRQAPVCAWFAPGRVLFMLRTGNGTD